MSLVIYNTLSREKEPFVPLDPAHVRLYVCGPTVYDYVHIGNARPVVAFDVLLPAAQAPLSARHLRAQHHRHRRPHHRARRRQQGADRGADRAHGDAYQSDMRRLGALAPDLSRAPRST